MDWYGRMYIYNILILILIISHPYLWWNRIIVFHVEIWYGMRYPSRTGWYDRTYPGTLIPRKNSGIYPWVHSEKKPGSNLDLLLLEVVGGSKLTLQPGPFNIRVIKEELGGWVYPKHIGCYCGKPSNHITPTYIDIPRTCLSCPKKWMSTSIWVPRSDVNGFSSEWRWVAGVLSDRKLVVLSHGLTPPTPSLPCFAILGNDLVVGSNPQNEWSFTFGRLESYSFFRWNR